MQTTKEGDRDVRRHARIILSVAAILVAVEVATSDAQTDNTAAACVPIKQVFSEKHWRQKHPDRGLTVCHAENRRGARNTIEHFHLYQHYRSIAHYHCPGGLPGEHYWVKPCAVVVCESEPDYSWGSLNPSGASDPYQLMPEWNPPWPVRTFAQRVRVHEIANGMSLSNWDASSSCWS
jgi:hypothetical protein